MRYRIVFFRMDLEKTCHICRFCSNVYDKVREVHDIISFMYVQVWNHDFFWESMQPGGGSMPILGVLQQIEKDFGSFTNFKDKFIQASLSHFGSGWVWLVCKFSDIDSTFLITAL